MPTATTTLHSIEFAGTATTSSAPRLRRFRGDRNPLPVGARFPRRSADQLHRYRLESVVTASAVPVFPIGARFPRRTQQDILAFLADVELGRRVPTRPAFPVGARLPRQVR